MAEETQPKPADPASTTEVVAAEAAVETKPEEEEVKKPEEETPSAAPAEEETKFAEEATEAAVEAAVEEVEVTQSSSFKEESNVVADLEDPEKKALDELKQLIQTALANNDFSPPPPPAPAAEKTPAKEEKADESKKEEEVTKAEEEPKTEEAAPAAEEQAKAEEPATVEPPKAEEPAPVAEEPPKAEEPAPAAEPAQPSEAEEKAVVVEEGDGAKTVEAIKETVISVEVTEETPAAAAEPESALPAEPTAEVAAVPPEELFIWGVPLLGDEKSDTVLLKFLRARDFKVKDALTMIKNAVIWRKQFGIDALVEEDLEVPELEKAVFYHGLDKEGHPVCYNVYGEFQDKEFYAKAFGDEEKREKFLRWRIQYLEKGIRQLLDFTPGAVCTMVQVTDLKNTPGPGKKELRVATKKALALLQDNYPEFVAKQIFINVPWWYLAYNKVISPFFTQRTKSKFVFAGPSKSAETLFKYIAPEQVPVQYGGLSQESDLDFTTADAVTEVTIKPATKHTIEITASEGSVLIWELRVLGWEVSYGAEFVPTAADGYTVIVQKARKFLPTDEAYVKNSFKIGEPGKVVLTIDNASSKKKKLLYRSKEKNSAESS